MKTEGNAILKIGYDASVRAYVCTHASRAANSRLNFEPPSPFSLRRLSQLNFPVKELKVCE